MNGTWVVTHYNLGEQVRWEISLKLDAPAIYYSSCHGAVDANDLYKLAHVFSKFKARGTKDVFYFNSWFVRYQCKIFLNMSTTESEQKLPLECGRKYILYRIWKKVF